MMDLACQPREIPAHAWLKAGEGQGAGPSGEKVATGSEGSIRLDREGAVSGLNPGPPAAGGSGTVQADVATSRRRHVEIGLGQQVVTERFQ